MVAADNKQFSENDQRGQLDYNLQETQKLSPKERREMFGASWTEIYQWYIEEDYNYLFMWTRKYDTYDEMYRSDSTIFKTLLAAKLPILSADREIRAPKQEDGTIDESDEEIRQFIEKNMFEYLQWWFIQFLSECLNNLRDWVSVFEKVYDIKDGKYVLSKLWVRLARTIDKRETENWESWITQTLPTPQPKSKKTTVSIPDSKLLVFSFLKEWDNYEWMSVLRPVAKNWIAKKNLENFELVWFEAQYKGARKVRVPENMDKESKEQYEDAISDFRVWNDNTIILPWEWYDFEFASMPLDSSWAIDNAIKRHDARITDVMLWLFMKLWESAKWSYWMSENNMWFFIMWLRFVANGITDVINKYLIKELVDLNYTDVEEYPKLVCGDLWEFDIEKISTALDRFTKHGLVTNDLDTEQRLREALGMPAKAIDSQEEYEQKIKDMKQSTQPNSNQDPLEQQDKDSWKEPEPKEEFNEKTACWCTKNKDFDDYASILDSETLMKFDEDLTSKQLDQIKKKSQNVKGSFPRPLTFAETKVNMKSMQNKMDGLEARIQNTFDELSEKELARALDIMTTAVEKDDISMVDDYTVSKDFTRWMAKEIADVRKDAFDYWKDSAASEIGAKTAATNIEQKAYMVVESKELTNRVAENIESAVKLSVTQNIARNSGMISMVRPSEITKSVKDAFTSVMNTATNSMRTLSVTWTINTGRGYIYERNTDEIYAFQYSAVIDRRTTNRCLSLDGRVVEPWSADFVNYTPPQHYRCRSIRVAILNDETFKPPIRWIPRSIQPTRDINNSQDLKSPVVLKDSAAAKQAESELEERRKKLKEYESKEKFPNRQEQHKQRIKQLERSLWINK